MKKEIIKTDNYLIIVSDDEIKVGDWCYGLNINDNNLTCIHNAGSFDLYKKHPKVIAHLPLNNSPILEGVDLLPELEQEYDVEKLGKLQWGNVHRTGVLGYIDGYNKAKEKYKYTEEDIRKAIYYGQNNNMPFFPPRYTEFIQSLSQQKHPIAFECEMEEMTIGGFIEGTDEAITIGKENKPKTTTNPQGQTVLVGKYIYND